jgi:hypothetical protein
VGRAVGLVLDCLDLLDPHSQVAWIFQDATQQLCPFRQVAGKLGEQLEKFLVAG